MANLWYQSENLYDFTADGKHIFQPSTGQIYVYLNGDVHPLLAGLAQAVTYTIPLTIFINGMDRTSSVITTSFSKTDVLTQQVDTCKFTVDDRYNEVQPTVGELVEVWYKPTALATPERIFGGEIISAPKQELANGLQDFSYSVSCTDHSKRLNSALVTDVYENVTAGAIIRDIVADYTTGYTTTNVQDGPAVSYIAFNYKNLTECIKELCKLTGYDYYVGYDKDIHFFSYETNSAPYTLTESILTTGYYNGLKITTDKSQLKNKIIVRGGTYLSELFTDEQTSTGVEVSYTLRYTPRAPMSVYVDAGAGYVAHTLGIENVDTSGKDFVINVNEKVIKNLDHATLSNGHKIKITYKYEIQVLTEDTDEESIELLKEIEGGTGTYEAIINDTTIETLTSAHDRAVAELDQYANPQIKGSFNTSQHGYRSGQLLSINMPTWGYNTSYLIQSVTSKLNSSNIFEYSVNFATSLKGLTEFLALLFDRGNEIIVRSSETLNDLSRLKIETVTVIPQAITYEERNAAPYLYDAADAVYGEAYYS